MLDIVSKHWEQVSGRAYFAQLTQRWAQPFQEYIHLLA